MFIDLNNRIFDDGAMVYNGAGLGDVGERMAAYRWDPGALQPFLPEQGPHRNVPCVTINTGRKEQNKQTGEWRPVYKTYPVFELLNRGFPIPVTSNATTMRVRDWQYLEGEVVKAFRNRLTLWGDLQQRVSVGGFNAMSKLTYEYEAMSDPGEARVDMDAIVDGRTDEPLFKLRSVPLPITHSDFFFSQRRLAVSQNSSTPLDQTMPEAAGRRVGEMVEKTAIGVETGLTFGTESAGTFAHDGTSAVYGLTNFPYRQTKTDLTTPTGSNSGAILTDVTEMLETMYTQGMYGPFILYHSTPYSLYLNQDYFATGTTTAQGTLRDRIMALEGISAIRRLDYLTSGYQLILVQMERSTVVAVDGMGISVVRWESQGGLRQNFKVMAIQVPVWKAPYSGVAAILHGTTS